MSNLCLTKSRVIITAEQAITHSEDSSVFICPNLIHNTLGLPVVTTNAFLFVLGGTWPVPGVQIVGEVHYII